MSILVTGAGGQLGRELLRNAGGLPVVGLTRAELDITDTAAVATALQRFAPRLLINTAAWTGVDRAEVEPVAAFAANRDGASVLARACAAAGIPLFHLSTEHVFDGRGERPWRETDPVAPLGVYGQSKYAGEVAIRNALTAHLVLRVSWVFSMHGRNFVRTLLSLGASSLPLRVVDDQVGGPTPAAALAHALLQLAGRYLEGGALPWGTYHFCGLPFLSRAAFAEAVFAAAVERALLPRRPVVQAIPSAAWPGAALRPANARLDCTLAQQRLGLVLPSWAEGLEQVLDDICSAAAGAS